mgnify:CR=1 FL=1
MPNDANSGIILKISKTRIAGATITYPVRDPALRWSTEIGYPAFYAPVKEEEEYKSNNDIVVMSGYGDSAVQFTPVLNRSSPPPSMVPCPLLIKPAMRPRYFAYPSLSARLYVNVPSPFDVIISPP